MVFVPDLQDTSIPTQIMRFFQQLLKWDREGTYDKAMDRAYANKLCFRDPTKLTISSGAITPQKAYHTVDSEGAAASDDLDTINATNFSIGDILILRAHDASRSIVLKHATGNIKISGAVDITLNEEYDSVILLYYGAYWLVLTILTSVSTSYGDHALMTHLTYASSGHTGFEPTITAGSPAQYYRGDKTWQPLNQAAISGLTTADSPSFAGATIGSLSYSEGEWTGGNLTYVPTTALIQDYIDAAISGDTLILGSGYYVEDITIDKPLTIIGQGIRNTIVDKIHISSSSVDLKCFGTYNGISARPSGGGDCITNINLTEMYVVAMLDSATPTAAINFVDADLSFFNGYIMALNIGGISSGIRLEFTDACVSTSPAIDITNVQVLAGGLTGTSGYGVEVVDSRSDTGVYTLNPAFFNCPITGLTLDADFSNWNLSKSVYTHGGINIDVSFINSVLRGEVVEENTGTITSFNTSLMPNFVDNPEIINIDGRFFGKVDSAKGYYVDDTPPVIDGTYTIGSRLTPGGSDGTITVKGGIIIAISEAT